MKTLTFGSGGDPMTLQQLMGLASTQNPRHLQFDGSAASDAVCAAALCPTAGSRSK